MKKYQTIKIWAETLLKLRMLSALSGQPIVKIIDKMADKELSKKEQK